VKKTKQQFSDGWNTVPRRGAGTATTQQRRNFSEGGGNGEGEREC